MPSLPNKWPLDYRAEYIKRVNLLKACEENKELRHNLMRHYARNPVDWINDWLITYNPRVVVPLPKTMPFMLFPRQVEFINFLHGCVTDKECGLVEKSRDVGATWLCSSYSIWLWLFTPGASIGWGSRKELLVDRLGDPDSIFQKMRMILNTLPAWMLPKGFSLRDHATYMKIINPVNGATITGESGDSIGRGGRSMVYFKDESAHYERPELIEASLGDNTDVQIDISSVHGTANVFYRRRMAGEIWVPGCRIEKGKTRVFIFDWRDHPGKTQEWYDQRRRKYETEGLLHLLAQEVDRDYASSVTRTIIPSQWIRAAIDAHVHLGFTGDGEKVAALDVADEGADKNAFAGRHGVVLKKAHCWGEGDTGETARLGYTMARELGCTEMNYDCIGVGAGVKAETNRMIAESIIPPTFKILPWNAAASPENPGHRIIPDDIDSPLIGDFFLNRKSQAWWSLRGRFERTFRAVTHGAKYDSADLISLSPDIPMLHQLVQELAQPVWTQNGKGKMMVDKKPDGAISPNLADSVVMCYFPMREYGPGMGYHQFLGTQVAKEKAERELASRPKPPESTQQGGVVVHHDSVSFDFDKLR
jgi:hypothetical protein